MSGQRNGGAKVVETIPRSSSAPVVSISSTVRIGVVSTRRLRTLRVKVGVPRTICHVIKNGPVLTIHDDGVV